MRRLLATLALLLPPLAAPAQEDLSSQPAPAGRYQIDPAHTRLLIRVNHLGFSHLTMVFREVKADLDFDPDHPERMKLSATVRPDSVETFYPDPAYDFNAFIAGPDLLDAAQFPEARFVSTGIVRSSPNAALLTGDLTLHGVTRPVTLDVTLNGGYGGHPLDVGARIGFSAHGLFNRSDFGVGLVLPPEGTAMGVFDPVELVLETELVMPRKAE